MRPDEVRTCGPREPARTLSADGSGDAVAAPPGVEPTPANVARTLNSALLLCIVLRTLLDSTSRDLPEELRVAAGEVVRQTERLVLEAQEGFDTLCFKGEVGSKTGRGR